MRENRSTFSAASRRICSESFGAAGWCRNWSAVSGACFSIRRATWESLGGFAHTPSYPGLDIDLCLRAQFEAGLRIVYNPFARFTQSATAPIEFWLRPDKDGEYIRASLPMEIRISTPTSF